MKRFLILSLLFFCNVAIAQTETTKWYIDGELYDTTSCESGGDINTPTVPARFGYTFSGWEPAVYDMSTLDATIRSSSFTQDSSTHRWSATFSYGVVYGESLCSPTAIDQYVLYDTGGLDTTTGEGRYCWCHIVEFIPTGSTKIYETKVSPWVGADDFETSSSCASQCLGRCRHYNANEYSKRVKMYGN